MYQQTDEETREMLAACGIVDKKPVTGVFGMNSLEFICDDIEAGNAIDLDFEEYCRHECPNRDNPPTDFEGDTPPEESEVGMCYECEYEADCDTYLIGFVYNAETGQYDTEDSAEYSAIVNTNLSTVQVVKSVWYIVGGLCSPCYPGQVDADNTDGDIMAYSVPPSVVGFDDCESEHWVNQKWSESVSLKARIFLLEHRELIENGLTIWNRSEYANYEHRDRHDRHSQNYYEVFLSAFSVGLVVAGNSQEALDIAIDHATAEKWEGLFLSVEDMERIVKENGVAGLDEYTSGGNESRYLSSFNVAIHELIPGKTKPVSQ